MYIRICVGVWAACCWMASVGAETPASGPAGAAVTDEGKLQVDADFPGGNIIVERIEGDRIELRQDRRDTDRWWFYWYFRVREAAGQTLTFVFRDGNPIGARGPAVSTDGGRTWAWLGTEAVKKASFTYTVPKDTGEVRFGFTIPYVDADLQAFLRRHRSNPRMKIVEMTRTRKGREVQAMHVGRFDGNPEHRVLITARHHSCETMASFVLEGLVESLLTDPARQWLRDNVEFLVVPFMDKDGVEDGDQGKSRSPHDHNRDYGGQSIYPTVRRLRQITPAWADGKLRMALDLHCPYIRGGRNETLYFVGPENQELWSNIERFSGILEALTVDGLCHQSKANLPFGKEWNTPERRGPGKSMSGWAGEIPGIWFASTLETPYANASGVEVTPETARVLGNRLAEAIERFLRE